MKESLFIVLIVVGLGSVIINNAATQLSQETTDCQRGNLDAAKHSMMQDYNRGGQALYSPLQDDPEYLECYNSAYCTSGIYSKAEEAGC